MKLVNIVLNVLLIASLLFCFLWIYTLEHNFNILKSQVSMYEILDYEKECQLEKDIRLLKQDVLILEKGYEE